MAILTEGQVYCELEQSDIETPSRIYQARSIVI